jgi:hypothetical protein
LGSGEGQIVSVKLLDASEEAQSVLSTLEPATIRVEMMANTPIQDVVVGVRIDALGGDPIWGTNTRRGGRTIGRLDGPARADLSIQALPLLEGVYDLTVALTDHTEMHPYDHWEKRIRFEVRQYKSYDAGLVHIPADWTITGAKGVLQTGM